MHSISNGIRRRGCNAQRKPIAGKGTFNDKIIDMAGIAGFFQSRILTMNKFSRRILVTGCPIMQEFLRGCGHCKQHQRKTCK